MNYHLFAVWLDVRDERVGGDWRYVWKVPLKWYMHYIYKKHPALIFFFFLWWGWEGSSDLGLWISGIQNDSCSQVWVSAGEGREEGISCDFSPSSVLFFSQKKVGSHYMLSITAFGSADGAPLSSSVQPGAGYHQSFFWLFNVRRLSSPKAQQQTGGMLPTATTVLLKSGGSSLTALRQKAAATVLSFPCQRVCPLVQRVRRPSDKFSWWADGPAEAGMPSEGSTRPLPTSPLTWHWLWRLGSFYKISEGAFSSRSSYP